jgi:hypothetical protein
LILTAPPPYGQYLFAALRAAGRLRHVTMTAPPPYGQYLFAALRAAAL